MIDLATAAYRPFTSSEMFGEPGELLSHPTAPVPVVVPSIAPPAVAVPVADTIWGAGRDEADRMDSPDVFTHALRRLREQHAGTDASHQAMADADAHPDPMLRDAFVTDDETDPADPSDSPF